MKPPPQVDPSVNLSAMVTVLPLGIILLNAQGKIELWNPAASQMLQYTAPEVLGKPCATFLGTAIESAHEALLAGSQSAIHDQKIQIKRADGTPTWIAFSLTPMPDESQTVLTLRSISHVINHQHQLAREQYYLSQVLELAPYGIVTLNADMSIVTFNRAAEQLTGRSATEAIGQPLDQIMQLAETDMMIDPRLNPTPNQPEGDRAYLCQAGGDTCPIRYSMAPLLLAEEERDGYIIIFEDISDIVAAERVKDEFISMVSHELRTPLTSIKGFVAAVLAEKAGPLTKQQKRFLTISREETEHLLDLINDLLDVSQLETAEFSLERERVDLADLLTQVNENIQPLAEQKNLTLATEFAPDLPQLWADPDRLTQLWRNLLANAVKFTPAGGDIVTKADYDANQDTFTLSVSDTGVGISPREQARIFDSFYQVENVHTRQAGGNGLGLVIVKKIVAAHDGEVEVESTVGEGTTFRVRLPRLTRRETVVRQQSTQIMQEVENLRQQDRLHNTERITPLILVVDDDPAINELIRFYLKQEGYDVIKAYNGQEALQLAQSRQPDLITLDILLPEMDGFHVLEALKEREETKEIPVCIISILEDKVKGYRLGGIDYFTKPFESERLLRAVNAALSPSISGTEMKILIIEDDLHTVELIEFALQDMPCQILVAHNGVTGLQKIYQQQPDLIILDIMLPKIDGHEILRRIKQNNNTAHIPVIILSVRELESDVAEALDLGADKYIVKSGQEEKLSQVVKEFLQDAHEST